jgi:ribosomal protein L37AE/L43A
MAMSLIFTCEQCGFSVEGWDEGNPYIINSKGKRVYCYHPSLETEMEQVVVELLGPIYTEQARNEVLATRTGNAADHVCMHCGNIFKLDPKHDPMQCPKCRQWEAADAVKAFEMGGMPCPKCHGTMSEGEMGAIS